MPPRVVLPLTDIELDALAAISASDMEAAAQQWREDAPEPHRRRLEAVAESVDRGTPPDA